MILSGDRSVSRKAPIATLEVYLKGVFPEDVAPRDLVEAIEAVQGLVATQLEPDAQGRVAVRLLDIKRGSARYLCTISEHEANLANLRGLGKQIERGTFSDSLAEAIGALEDLSKLGKRLGCSVVLRNPEDREDVLATVRPETFQELAQSLLTTGNITVTGTVERVGGATEPKCLLRIPGQRRVVVCRLASRALARTLGKYVYSDVQAAGRAVWIRGTHRVIRFRIESITPVSVGPVLDGFASLRRIGGKAWDSIENPREFLSDQTGT
jgi:hypothetical protein